jgi:signal peptidase I
MNKNNLKFYRGSSMKGTFKPGDCLIVGSVEISEICLGDILVFKSQNQKGEEAELVHRLIDIKPDGLVTRGDNNYCNDAGLVTAENIIGRVIHFERSGEKRKVRNGYIGLWRGQLLHARVKVYKWLKLLGKTPYRWLKKSKLATLFWSPIIIKLELNTEKGPLVKFLNGSKTIALWWPQDKRFECKKPYDLILKIDELVSETKD